MAAPTPAMDGIIHVALTVTDVDASVAWYRQVLSLKQVGIARHEGGFGIVMSTPDEGVWLVLHHHDANSGEAFTETRTGLDHVAFHVRDDRSVAREGRRGGGGGGDPGSHRGPARWRRARPG